MGEMLFDKLLREPQSRFEKRAAEEIGQNSKK
jgi:hypothetical protein